MKLSPAFLATAFLAFTSSAVAFPEYLARGFNIYPSSAATDTPLQAAFRKKVAEVKAGGDVFERRANTTRRNENEEYPRTIFSLLNPEAFDYNERDQYIDLTSDQHKFIAPGPRDIRGPCPGLNLLANHNYLPRNGVTTVAQAIDAINRVFGVEVELSTALSVYAAVFNGNVLDTTWSIGGPYTPTGIAGGVLDLAGGAEPQGISAHNVYEGDASIVREDYYQPGANNDNVHLNIQLFKELLELGGNDTTVGKDVYTSDLMLKHKSIRWEQSVQRNPLFYNSPFGGLIVTTAAERFVAEFAANNTAGPDGKNFIYLDEPNLLAFFGVTKHADGTLEYKPGQERLLPSWHRRPLAAQFGLGDIVLTLLNAAKTNPHLLSIGGNAGKVNTFTGVDVGDLTGGLYNTQTLLADPAALSCYLYQGFESALPSVLGNLYKVVDDALSLLNKNYNPVWHKAATANGNPCKSYQANLEKQSAKYPGSKVGNK
ncbi:hypothetical protein K437DRAFT_157159 [Tilletiaria anomala UBC 951]|uniref:Heme haloperoxidase family profile domain-containing protein n=1 Tax=Tilletiaria anomala (strain ATCC 24038 / CBS 436.72 / UBC 951) TaxID=1037660 RepID=A0A066VVR2_TILAU|nr:uncharacterized protein K437DRAFT_157159 [Tilletiaria anomala UBC 951]KDN42879.1 hypothetical protein K437DRAFT_157159 [Tilletiaria anomala UBC 951]